MIKKVNHEQTNDTKILDQLPKQFMNQLNFENSTQQLEELKQLIFHTPAVNQAKKIAFIKEEIAENRYQVGTLSIAEKLLEQTPVINDLEPA